MGWSTRAGILWGDEPQDIVDEATGEKLRNEGYTVDDLIEDRIPLRVRQKVYRSLLRDAKLKEAVDDAYSQVTETGRGAFKKEYANLLRVSLGLGGRTIW